jgi:hypothetical protein
MQTRTLLTRFFKAENFFPDRNMWAILSLIAGLLILTACAGETITVNAPPPPREWMVCEKLPAAPDLEPLVAFQLSDGRTVYLVDDVNARDAQISRYVVAVRGAWFSCANNLEKVRGYHGG